MVYINIEIFQSRLENLNQIHFLDIPYQFCLLKSHVNQNEHDLVQNVRP